MAHPAFYSKEVDGKQKQFVRVPIPKASTKDQTFYVDICVEDIPNDVMGEMIFKGAKSLATLGMTNISGDKRPEELKAAAEKATENVEKILKGEVRITGGKVKPKKGKLDTLAMQRARLTVKAQLQKKGKKISLISAADITKLAERLLAHPEHGPVIYAEAQAMLNKIEQDISIDMGDVKEDPKLAAKAAAAKGKKAKVKEELDELGVDELMAAQGSVKPAKRGEARR